MWQSFQSVCHQAKQGRLQEWMMGNARLDTKKAVAVNKGLATALLVDIQSGVKVMCEAGIPAETAARIILHPRRRRAGDWKHE